MIDILRILKDYSISHDTNVNPGWVNVNCPFCHPKDTGHHGGFKLDGEYYNCWKCGGHRLDSTLMRLLRLDYSAYQEFIGQYSTEMMIRARLNRKTPKAKSVDLPGDELNFAEKAYLSGRGFDPDYLVRKYKIQGGGIAGRWKYRIIIPIFFNGQVVSFTARDITGKQDPRYKNLSIEESVVDPKTIFYNIDNARGSTVCLLEGPADVWRMGNDFICSFGTSMEEAQIKFLSRNFKEVLIMFDPEPLAQQKARKYAEALSVIGGLSTYLIDMEYECDPGDLSDDQARRLRRDLGFGEGVM